jgi:hypothetical protein
MKGSEYRYIRLRCADGQDEGNSSLCIFSWEIYGTHVDGVIGHLTRECRGNVHDRNVVVATSSGTYDGYLRNAAKNIAELHKDSAFCSADEPDSWIRYEFKDRITIPSSCSIRALEHFPGQKSQKDYRFQFPRRSGSMPLGDSGPRSSQRRESDSEPTPPHGPVPKSWVVQCSMDGIDEEDWTEVDNREDLNAWRTDEGRKNDVRRTFRVKRSLDIGCRYIRLKSTGLNHAGSYFLCMAAWEIFGSLIEGLIVKLTRECRATSTRTTRSM